jgi:hypothetical protein
MNQSVLYTALVIFFYIINQQFFCCCHFYQFFADSPSIFLTFVPLLIITEGSSLIKLFTLEALTTLELSLPASKAF